jgi:hypothetical protein
MEILTALALLVPVASAIASGVNEVIRQEGKKPTKGWAIASAVVNTLALNADKVKQAVGVIRGKK